MENTVLKGHTSPETAYVVDDYPYGFRLRCKIRYWLEFKESKGFRLVSQTTDPKRSYEFWNKPKASTYCMLAVMVLDSKNHVTWTGCNHYQFDEVEAFTKLYGEHFNEAQAAVAGRAILALNRYNESKSSRS